VRAAAARCGPLRTGATGLEPAASGVTERRSAAQSPRKHVGWELSRSLRRHLLPAAAGRCAPQAPASRLMPVSIQDAINVILLWGSDRLTAVRVHRRRRSQRASSVLKPAETSRRAKQSRIPALVANPARAIGRLRRDPRRKRDPRRRDLTPLVAVDDCSPSGGSVLRSHQARPPIVRGGRPTPELGSARLRTRKEERAAGALYGRRSA
jgi:hypothetical protein